jgi:hypothetical protein
MKFHVEEEEEEEEETSTAENNWQALSHKFASSSPRH